MPELLFAPAHSACPNLSRKGFCCAYCSALHPMRSGTVPCMISLLPYVAAACALTANM